MAIQIKYYGKLAELAGSENINIETKSNNVSDLLEELNESIPKLNTEIFALFLNNKKIEDFNQAIKDKDEICLMPPFAGG